MYSGYSSPTRTAQPPHAAAVRPVALRRRVLITLVALMALCALIPLQRAAAADITGQVTKSASVRSGTYNEWAALRVDVSFKVARANTGDTFTMPLDKMLDARRFVSLDLKDPAGAVVARVTIKKDTSGAPARDAAGNGILVFTFTNYVATHTNISGSAWFAITFDHSRIIFPAGSTTMNTTVYGTNVTIAGNPGPVGNEFLKYGNWRSPNNNETEATALNPDGSSANPGADITWTIQLQGGSQSRAPGWTRATITDTPAAGTHFECPLTPAPSATRKDPTTPLDRWLNTTVPTITVSACSRSSLTLVITKATTDTSIYRIRFPGWIDGAPMPATFGNTAQLRYQMPSGSTFNNGVSTSMTHADQGGTAVGSAAPKIDIENYCQTWSGVVFTGGVPQLVNGQPSPQPTPCDYDTAPGLAVAKGATTPVTFRITNTGTETLKNVVVTDSTTTGTALTNIKCTFNGSSTMPFAGLAPGQSFLCTATLPAITANHGNVAKVTALGATSNIPVSDSDAWHAHPDSIVLPPSPPKLILTKAPLDAVAKTGRTTKWRITVKNSGKVTAFHLKVCDVLRDKQAFPTTTVTYTIGTSTKSTRMAIAAGKGCFKIPSLAAGKRAVVTVRTLVPATARVRVRNKATVTADLFKEITADAKVPVIKIGGGNVPSPTG